MPSATAYIGSGKWLKAADLLPLNQKRIAVVQHVEPGVVGMGADAKDQLILDLTSRQGQPWPKKLTLNTTRTMAMVAAFGDDYSQWTGKAIEVWAENVMFAGKFVPGMKVGAAPNGTASVGTPMPQQQPRIPSSSATAATGIPPVAGPNWSPPKRPMDDDLDDEIPF